MMLDRYFQGRLFFEADKGANPTIATTTQVDDSKGDDSKEDAPLSPVDQLKQRNEYLKQVQLNRKLEADQQAEQVQIVPATLESPADQGVSLAKTVGDTSQQIAGKAQDSISRLKTPGGILLLFSILILFLMLVVPVNENGDTRAMLLFYTLNGRTKLKGAITQQDLQAQSNPGANPTGAVQGAINGTSQTVGTAADTVGTSVQDALNGISSVLGQDWSNLIP